MVALSWFRELFPSKVGKTEGGKTPSEIADMIGCNVNTISTFRSRVLKKLELKTSMDIVRYAITRNLVQLS